MQALREPVIEGQTLRHQTFVEVQVLADQAAQAGGVGGLAILSPGGQAQQLSGQQGIGLKRLGVGAHLAGQEARHPRAQLTVVEQRLQNFHADQA